jgi:drug/metabolite transporter (DMT)-like permease
MDNTRGALLMVAAMLAFAIEDLFIKKLAEAGVPLGQLILYLGLGGALAFGIAVRARGEALLSPALLTRGVLLRNVGEIVGTLGFVSAIALTPISSASAIFQANPLAVTLGAALFLGASVGWRRWTAIGVGFAGVLMIVRPGAADFDPRSIYAVIAVVGLALRDLATRTVARDVSSMQLSAWGFAMLIPAGLFMFWLTGQAPVAFLPWQWGFMAAALLCGLLGYYAIVAASRLGDIAFVTSFRYSRMLFALIIGALFFGERPDLLTLAGAALIVGSGLYTLLRERRLTRAARNA